MIINCESIYKMYLGAKFLGTGTTAHAFFKDEKVLKVYRNTKRSRYVFNEFNDMVEHLLELSEIKVEKVSTPVDIYIQNNIVKAISLEFVDGITLKEKIPDVNIDIFFNYLKEFEEMAYKLSEKRVWVKDFHSGNVIINENGINVIDTDEYYITGFDKYTCLEHNLNTLFHNLFYGIFLFERGFYFESEYLNALLEKYLNIYGTYEDDLKLYYAICNEIGNDKSLVEINKLIKTLGRVKK